MNDDLGAFNWIIIDATCPACSKDTVVRCQTHIAASYRGDATGRFHDREYRLGQPMAWFPIGDPHYGEWNDRLVNDAGESSMGDEACYSECMGCDAELCVVIRFRGFVPEHVVGISTEDNWPEGFPR